MNNPIVLRTTAIVSFIISAIFTIMLMTSGIIDAFPYILTATTSIILELAKCGFIYEALINKNLNKIIRTVMIIISLILIGSSILASSAFILNQANKTKNKQIQSSAQFKQLEQSRLLQQDLYQTKKQEIEDLKALQLNQKDIGTTIVNTMPNNYTDKKNEQRRITSQQIAETQKMIDKKSTELSQLELKLQNPINTASLKINSEHGYTSIFIKMTELINTTKQLKDNPITPEAMEMWFYMLLMVLFEFVTVVTAYLAQLKSKTTTNTVEPFGTTESEQVNDTETLNTTEPYKGLGIDKDKVAKYVEYMYNNLKNNNQSRGYNTIGQYTGLGVENARKVKSYLEKLGIVHTVGTKTYTKVDLQTCKTKLQIQC